MGQPDLSRGGIELDLISLPGQDISEKRDKIETGESAPSDHTQFVSWIFRQMMAHESFLTFSGQIRDINKILTMKYSSATDIAKVILKDMALTAKILKLVNSSFYRHFSTKGISTLSEAMIILGTDEIKAAAAGLKIYEMMKDLANTRLLREKTLISIQQSILSQLIAREKGMDDTDLLQVSALICNLGEYLVLLFSPDQYIEIAIYADEKQVTANHASKVVLGISYSDLTRVVGLKLNLPGTIVETVKPVSVFDIPRKRMPSKALLQYTCSFVNELCNRPMAQNQERLETDIFKIARKYQTCMEMDPVTVLRLFEKSLKKIEEHTAALDAVSDPQQFLGRKR